MTPPIHVDLHILQDVPPANLNRDDAGTPKQAVYGGVTRLRVSSQAWKRATRVHFRGTLDEADLGTRTRRIGHLLMERFQAKGATPERAEELGKAAAEALGVKASKKKLEELSYLLFLSDRQIEGIVAAVTQAAGDASGDELKEAVKAAGLRETMGSGHSLDVALFGRMVADMADLNVDAAAQVAHAISTHAADTQFDYFTAVDDHIEDNESGAGMIGTVEFSSGTLYRYATVSADQLAANLGDARSAVDGIGQFIRSFALSMPTGKQNSFAAHTRPGLVLAVVRDTQPVSLVGAFERPVKSDSGILAASIESLAATYADETARWGDTPLAVAANYVGGLDESVTRALGPSVQLDDLVAQTQDAVTKHLGAGTDE